MTWESNIISFIFMHVAVGALISGALFFLKAVKDRIAFSSEALSWLWYFGYLSIAIIPLVAILNPASTIESVSSSYMKSDAGSFAPTRISTTAESVEMPFMVKKDFPRHLNVSSTTASTLSAVLKSFLLLWAIGLIWRGFGLARTIMATARLSKTAKETRLFRDLVEGHQTPICLSDQISSPLVIGFQSPKIVLPESLARNISKNQAQHILTHELAHIKRGDIWTGLLQEIIAVVFWISPILRIVCQQVSLSREIACDSRAAEKSEDQETYAQSLVQCAKQIALDQEKIHAMGMCHRNNDIKIRIREVMKMKGNKSSTVGACLTGALLMIASFALAESSAASIEISLSKADALKPKRGAITGGDAEILVSAVKANRISVIKHLIQNEGFHIDAPTKGDGTALIVAVQRGDERMVEQLLEMGADVNAASDTDGNPLINAAMRGNVSLAERLLESGADVNAYVYRDETPLICASMRGHLEMVKFLVENGANVNLEVETPHGEAPDNVRSPLSVAPSSQIRDYLRSQGAK